MSFVKENYDPFTFDLDANGILALTEDNVARVQFLIANDSRYRSGELEDFLEIHPDLLDEDVLHSECGVSQLEAVVTIIDNVNSTHQASEGPQGGNQGRRKTAEAIACIGNVEERLKSGDPSLVDEIACALEGRYTFSFATKFCTYIAWELFGSDAYSIYDDVVSRTLPYYAWVYLGEKNPQRNGQCVQNPYAKFGDKNFADQEEWRYENYLRLIGKIIARNEEKIGYRIGRRDFDQLLWYYYKGNEPRLEASRRKIAEDECEASRENFLEAANSSPVRCHWSTSQ